MATLQEKVERFERAVGSFRTASVDMQNRMGAQGALLSHSISAQNEVLSAAVEVIKELANKCSE